MSTRSTGIYSNGREPKIDHIIKIVAENCNINVQLIHSYNRHGYIVLTRQIAMYLIRYNTNFTLEVIGTHLGGRTPATIHCGIKRLTLLKSYSDVLSNFIDGIEKCLNNH